MGIIEERIQRIIIEKRIDAICSDGVRSLTIEEVWDEVKTILPFYIANCLNYKKVVIYPGGRLGRKIVDCLFESELEIEYIIDNYTSDIEYRGIPIIDYAAWLNRSNTEVYIIIAAIKNREAFINNIILDGFDDRYIDIWKWLERNFQNIDLYQCEKCIKWDLHKVNTLLEKYDGTSKTIPALRAVIYALVCMHDYGNAEKYAEKLRAFSSFVNYQELFTFVRKTINSVVNSGRIKNVFVVHIIDSLENGMIDSIPWLRRYSQKNIRFNRLASQYTFTEYCVNTMFTSNDAFDIEIQGKQIRWDDSELLKYIRDNFSFTVISGDSNVMQEFDGLNRKRGNVYRRELTDILFQGIEALNEVGENHFIVLHSIGEIHVPFRNVGQAYFYDNNISSRQVFHDQVANAFNYVDSIFNWYGEFYDISGISNIFVGDHGIWTEAVIDYNIGIKNDLPFLNFNESTPACVLGGHDICKQEIGGLIPAKSLSNIFLDFIMGNTKFDNYEVEYSDIQQLPIFNPNMAKRFISKGGYAQYEGLIGVRGRDEIYLITASGKEMYFKPNEKGYCNLANNSCYLEDKKRISSYLPRKTRLYEVYRLEKYRAHLDILKEYDETAYLFIENAMKDDYFIHVD